MLTLFHEHYKVRYAPRGLVAWLLYVISLLVVLVIPFVIAFMLNNFWLTNNFFFSNPEVHFTGRCVLRVTTVQGRELLWTCSEAFNEEFVFGTELDVLPFVSLFEDDRDGNGKMDVFSVLLSVPITTFNVSLYTNPSDLPVGAVLDAVQEIAFLPEFTYRINSKVQKVNMTAAPLLTYARRGSYHPSQQDNTINAFSAGPVCLLTEADLVFHSNTRLSGKPPAAYMTSPLRDSLREPADVFNLAQFAQYYTARNQSVTARVFTEAAGGPEVLKSSEHVRGLGDDLDTLNDFTWRITLRIPPAKVFYSPGAGESIKWAWAQYFTIAFVIQWVMWQIRGMIVTMGLIDTNAFYHARRVR